MKKNALDQYKRVSNDKLKPMSQIDISSYSSIIIWSSIVFICGFIYIYSFNLPNFIFKTQIKDKLKNIIVFSFFFKVNEIKNNNEFFLIIQLKNLIQPIK